jgi:hypothetical protein
MFDGFSAFFNSIKKHPLGSVWIVGGTSTRTPPPPEVAQLLNEPQSITTFTWVLKENVFFIQKNIPELKLGYCWLHGWHDLKYNVWNLHPLCPHPVP